MKMTKKIKKSSTTDNKVSNWTVYYYWHEGVSTFHDRKVFRGATKKDVIRRFASKFPTAGIISVE